MQRPIEQLGWHKRQLNDYCETYYKGKNQLNSSVCISFNIESGELVSIVNDSTITLEELQAIYETAKQIREENKYDK